MGDRYYRDGLTWVDLATGDDVDVVIASGGRHGAPSHRPGRSHIDDGTDVSFGAFHVFGRPLTTPAAVVSGVAGDLVGRAVRATRGVDSRLDRVVRWATSGWEEARMAIRHTAVALEREGFLACRAREPRRQDVAAALVGRHLAIFVYGDGDRLACGRRLVALASESARGHLVVDVSPRGPRFGSGRLGQRAERSVGAGVPRRAVGRLIDTGDLRAAETWISAWLAEAASTRQRCPRALEEAVVRLLTGQGRREEADTVRRVSVERAFPALWWRTHPRPSQPRRRRVHVSGFQQEQTMYLLDVLPDVLQVVAEAEDDLGALTGAARWARETSHADLVAFVTGEGGRTLALDCVRGDALRDDERTTAVRAADGCRIEHADGVSIIAPIRYAGVCLGAVVVRGAAARERTLSEAARTLAAVSAPAVRTRTEILRLTVDGRDKVPEIVGRSPAVVAVREAICRAAATSFAVLIEGESGTGKELVARAIHRLSPRHGRRFAAVNCAALTDDLIDTELFGHTRGAFTGAIGPRAGLFEEADGGSLFLDEVAELSARAQAKLLRTIQEREVRRVGENAPRRVDARIVAATNRWLGDLSARGEFREDLLFRLAVVRLKIPPLRERSEDIAPLAATFWQLIARETATRALLGPDALARLTSHLWPGNVRELQNVMARLSLAAPPRGRVTSRHVDLVLTDSGGPGLVPAQSLDRARRSVERRTVAAALARHGGRRTAAARELGLSRQGLTKAIRRLSLETGLSHVGVA